MNSSLAGALGVHMGWDLHIFKFEPGVESVLSLPEEYQPLIMGSAEENRATISRHFPGTDWRDLTWGMYESREFALEFSIKEQGIIDGFAIHVHGSGDPVIPIIAMCKAQAWSLYDTSLGDLVDLENPESACWKAFQEFRNSVLEQGRNSS